MTNRNEAPEPGIDEQINILSIEITEAAPLASDEPVVILDVDEAESILATLRKYKAITEAPMPEPVAWMHKSLTHPQYNAGIHMEKRDGWNHEPLYGPDLLAYAQKMQVERDAVRLRWVDSEGVNHSITKSGAIETLHKFFEEWPCGLEEIESSLNQHKQLLSETEKRADLAESQRDALLNATKNNVTS